MRAIFGRSMARAAFAAMLTMAALPASAAYFQTDFESGLPGELTGVGYLDGTQGYAAHGFGSTFLRNSAAAGQPITLTLTGLPAHSALSLDFFLAIIDSWDGTDSGQSHPVVPDFLNITVDGTPIFVETFENSSAGGFATSQSYVPPSGVTLARYADLGFTPAGSPPYYVDSAYNMGLDTQFDAIPHTASTLTIQWFASGAGWQGSPDDESFAIDNLAITLLDDMGREVPEPAAAALFLGLSALAFAQYRRRRPVSQAA
jgi:hypothetical protein